MAIKNRRCENGLQVIIDDDYSKITSEQKANHAFEILKELMIKILGKDISHKF